MNKNEQIEHNEHDKNLINHDSIEEQNNSSHTDKNSVPLGHVFEQARKDASLSIKDVAEKLNLSKSIIRDLEGDIDWLIKSKKYTPLYFRGYISNYASLLSLKSIDSFPEFQKLIEVNRASIAPNASSTILLESNKKKPAFIVLSLAILLTAALVYLGSGYFLNDEIGADVNIESISSTDPLLENTSAIDETENVLVKPAEKAEKKTDLIDEVKNEVISIKKEITKKFETEKKVVKPIVETKVETALVKKNVVEKKVIEPKITKVIEEKVVQVKSPLTQKNVVDSKIVQNIETLSLEFKDNCWTEIKDSTGKRLAFNLYKNGDTLTLKGVPPFKISLGNPTEVSVKYQGSEISGEFIKGTTAHFTVPK